MAEDQKRIVFFDGVCNLCNSSVQRIIRNDPRQKFYFSSLQSAFAKNELSRRHIDLDKTDSIIYLDKKGRLHDKSGAVLRVASLMKFPYPLFSVFLIVPPFIRNAVYDWIARNRYKWYGKKDSCMIPDPQLKQRFLD